MITESNLSGNSNLESALGAKSDSVASTDTGTFSLIALFKRLLDKLTNVISVKITDGAGNVNTKQLGTQLTNSDIGIVANTIIHGLTTVGDGTFVDVKVSPSGAIQVGGTLDGITNNVPVLLKGTQNDNSVKNVSVTNDGHIEVEIHNPLLPFGSLHTESMSPVFQFDGVYGTNVGLETVNVSGSGTVTGVDGLITVNTGTTIFSFAAIQSRKRLRYRDGQGSILRFTAIFPTPVASSVLVVGLGHSEDGFYIGYNGTSFGILYSHHGVRETRTLTITTASSTTQNVVVTLNSVAFNVPVTNSANIQRTVYEIASLTYAGWHAQAIGATIVFIRGSAGVANGSYSVSGTTIVGAFAQTKAGVAASETWVSQVDWNGDKLNGTGTSGFTINPQRLNVFQINMQYLGAGTVTIKCEIVPSNSNNPIFIDIHTFRFPNTLTIPSVGNPSFPFTMASYSAGSTASLPLSTASVAGFIEGEIVRHGNRLTYRNSTAAVNSANYRALFTIGSKVFYGNRANQAVINLLSVGGAVKHNSPVSILLIRNATLAGNPNFSSYSDSSISVFDTSAATCTFTDNNQIIWSKDLGDTGDFIFSFTDEITLQPCEYLTVCAISTTGSPTYVSAAINTREDQ